MERRLNAVRKIEYGFAFIVTRIKLSNKLNFTDVNIVAEDFFKLLFNRLYDYDLKNANSKSQNETAIDLYYTKERIAYQITSQNRTTKISKTVDDFIRTEKYKSYSTFIIFSITAQNKCSSASMEKLSEHNVEFKYINVFDLQSEILREFDTEKLESIAEFLEYQISTNKQDKKEEPGWVDEKLKTLHIVDQIDTVLNYFEGFNLIYPRTLSRIYPFNLEKKVYDAYSNRCLKTNNKEIHELLQKVKINSNKELEISDESLFPFHDKLRVIFEKLNNSLVDCICYRENYTEIEHHKISIKRYISDCNCNQCKYQKFKTKELFSELKTKSIVHSDDLLEALNEGYYFCKLGEHIKGWQIFDSIVLKSLQQKKHIINFLAQHNNLAIYNFIDSPWWENEAKAILPKLEQVNLHNILCQANAPAIVIDELIKVKEDYHLNYSRERIEEYADRLKELNILYSNTGYSSSYPTIKLLKQEIHLLFAFYTSNSIITDDFSTFQHTIIKGIDGILYSYTTDSRYEYRYKKFDWFFF